MTTVTNSGPTPTAPTPQDQDGPRERAHEPFKRGLLRQIRPAIMLTLLLTLITGIAYPTAVTAVAQALFPSQANGSLVSVDGKPVGSKLIGQYWTQPQYFHGRPSATNNLQGT